MTLTVSVCDERTLQKVGDVLQLRNVVLAKTTVLHHQWEDVVVLLAGVRWKELGQILEDRSPCGRLLFGVFHPRNWRSAVGVLGGTVGEFV